MKTLYRVENGLVEHCPPASTDVDDTESVLVYAEDEAAALALADQYDAGEIQHDNVTIGSRTYAALVARE